MVKRTTVVLASNMKSKHNVDMRSLTPHQKQELIHEWDLYFTAFYPILSQNFEKSTFSFHHD